jgi:hypothetical protein
MRPEPASVSSRDSMVMTGAKQLYGMPASVAIPVDLPALAWRVGILAPLDRRAADFSRFPSFWRSAHWADRRSNLGPIDFGVVGPTRA